MNLPATTKGRNVNNNTPATTAEEICKCGFTYEDWMSFDIYCPAEGNNDLHLWEREN